MKLRIVQQFGWPVLGLPSMHEHYNDHLGFLILRTALIDEIFYQNSNFKSFKIEKEKKKKGRKNPDKLLR